jgi:DNA-directed RNA polymerase specialized sigma24 family protein
LLDRLRSHGEPETASADIERVFSEHLAAAMASLSPEERALLGAKYEEGEPTAALAAAANCSEKAMESRLARLRQRVRGSVLSAFRHAD